MNRHVRYDSLGRAEIVDGKPPTSSLGAWWNPFSWFERDGDVTWTHTDREGKKHYKKGFREAKATRK